VRGADTPLQPSAPQKPSGTHASEWVRGQSEPLTGENTSSDCRSYCIRAITCRIDDCGVCLSNHIAAGTQAHQGRGRPDAPKHSAKKHGHAHHKFTAASAQASSWKPKARQACEQDEKRAHASQPTPPKTTAKSPEARKHALNEQIKRKEEQAATLRRKVQAKKAQHEMKVAMSIKREMDEQRAAREQAQKIASEMEGSGTRPAVCEHEWWYLSCPTACASAVKLKEKRKLYEEEHKHEIEAKAQQQASKARRIQLEDDQRKAIRRILKGHSSHYDVLMVLSLCIPGLQQHACAGSATST
jgi:hypothetical protein